MHQASPGDHRLAAGSGHHPISLREQRALVGREFVGFGSTNPADVPLQRVELAGGRDGTVGVTAATGEPGKNDTEHETGTPRPNRSSRT